MPSTRVDILDGTHWVVFRGEDTITNRQRRPYGRCFARIVAGERPQDDADFAEEFAHAVTFMYLDSWSIDVPVPRDFDAYLLWADDQPAVLTDAINIASMAHYAGISAKAKQAIEDANADPPPSP